MEKLLEVKDLEVTFGLRSGAVKAIKGIDFHLAPGERLGLVGESGAGKSVAGFSILNLISKPGYISNGQILFEGKDLAKLTPSKMRSIRGNRISMIFQDPMMTLNPVLTVGTQMMEIVMTHQKGMTKDKAREIALQKLKQVQIPSPEKRIDQYPHELSGGMRQRIVIACALMSDPSLIIADEPTTALDVTIQAEIMELLLELCKSEGMSMILITHDLAVVSQVTERIAVMYAGKIVETGVTSEIIKHPRHPYTLGLLKALPQKAKGETRLNQIPGVMPGLTKLPQGCAFNPRCEFADDKCRSEVPPLRTCKDGNHHFVACHHTDKTKQPE
jgi:peptide/nickel transport system ATP-binding protein